MKLREALEIIGREQGNKGYRVSFEHREGKMLASDYFPARDEPLIEKEETAWWLARAFAAQTVGRCVNIGVVDSAFVPVPGCEHRQIENRVAL